MRDLTIAISKNEIQVKNKGSLFIEYLTGLIDSPIDCEVDWEPGDPVFEALKNSFWTEDSVEFVLLDGGIRRVGAEGLRASFIVTKFERSEPLEEVMSASVSLRLSAASPDKPQWVRVATGGTIQIVGEFGEDPLNNPA